MDIKSKMNSNFKNLQGGLFLEVTKADVGEGVGKFVAAGGEVMAWADMYFPDPSIPESVKQAMHEAIDSGFPAHYVMPIGQYELRVALAEHITEMTGMSIDPSRNVIVTPGSDTGLLYSMMPFLCAGDEVLVPEPCYPSNLLNPKLLGAVTVPVPLYEEDNYQFRLEEFEKKAYQKDKDGSYNTPKQPNDNCFFEEKAWNNCVSLLLKMI